MRSVSLFSRNQGVKGTIGLSLLLVMLLLNSCKLFGPKEWEYLNETFTYQETCARLATEALTDENNKAYARAMADEYGYSAEMIQTIWEWRNSFLSTFTTDAARKVVTDYSACGKEELNTHLTEMGKQKWEMVSAVELTIPVESGDQLGMGGIGWGYEIIWKR